MYTDYHHIIFALHVCNIWRYAFQIMTVWNHFFGREVTHDSVWPHHDLCRTYVKIISLIYRAISRMNLDQNKTNKTIEGEQVVQRDHKAGRVDASRSTQGHLRLTWWVSAYVFNHFRMETTAYVLPLFLKVHKKVRNTESNNKNRSKWCKTNRPYIIIVGLEFKD